jgi:hypothetical protein
MAQTTARAIATGRAAEARPLPPGTRVQLKDGAKHKGTVMPYTPDCSPSLLGLFPVRLYTAIWQICDASDVIVLPPPTQVDQ